MTERQFKVLLNKFLSDKATEKDIKLIREFETYFLDKNHRNVSVHPNYKGILEREIYTVVKEKMAVSSFPWFKVAASFILLLGVGSLFLSLLNTQPQDSIVSNTSDSLKIIELSDGSEIILNRNSQIRYSEDFNSEDRNIALTGEAFFTVTKDENKPFTVTTQKLTTQVLGTAFNIKETDSIINVTVSEGLVNVYDKHANYDLTPNQQLVYNISASTMTKKSIDYNLMTYWSQDKITLQQVNFKDLAVVLEDLYGVQVVVEGLESLEMSITFSKDESLASVVDKISYINNVKLKIKDQMVLVTP